MMRSMLFGLLLMASAVAAGCEFGKATAEAEREKAVLERQLAELRHAKHGRDVDGSEPAHSGAPAPNPVEPPRGAPPSFADLARKADAAVVFVRTLTARRRGFRRYLGEGSGSGFVFDENGKILTNHHVVHGAQAIVVEFADGSSFKAKVVGADPHTDVAVLEVRADKKLPALAWGDSDRTQVGDWVLAIGNPFGLEHTVSAGIISAKERTSQDVNVGDASSYYSFLQTDASINPGNSGGPLIDLEGRVVGMNTAINPQANSIGFAIPVNMIRELVPRLLRDGVVRRAALGVVVADVRQSDRDELGLPNRDGALIVQVQRGGPAAAAGFEPFDVVVEFDGKPVDTPEDLRWRASLAPIDRPVKIVVVRKGQRQVLDAQLVPLPNESRTFR